MKREEIPAGCGAIRSVPHSYEEFRNLSPDCEAPAGFIRFWKDVRE
ncbi:MAG: hypothetical protein HS118_08555 [Bacteroidia bacterium]|nr:hypothetical protein [Bacteroidia bacterium]MCB8931063.1 hypothetical protein [Bacteroidia bacterium]MCB8931064.1 hypothetical protein [Bacteroidia bacterium]